ncbi:NACHT domain-containing protein [Mycoavidus sp. SF9855]|uniref:WD40 domain-containing protein n=1 Tax=Mycoavidus sp. SF9855 TaxID=2968475 RepID=UPI00211BCDE9|nr:NACHT domain-containing protein [Mycoavidus sp. SF9855]UUM21573.1 NACHT domain-containing protein [Mycoavidus sp. SF9855]
MSDNTASSRKRGAEHGSGSERLNKKSVRIRERRITTLQTSRGSNNIQIIGSNNIVSLLEKSNTYAKTEHYKPLVQLGGNDNIEALKVAYLKTLEELDAVKDALDLYVAPQGQESVRARETFPLIDKVRDFLFSKNKVFLLLGEAGSGKSTFNRYLTRTLWAEYQQSSAAPIPLFIALAEHTPSCQDLISSYLLEQGFSAEAIEELKRERLVFILDGFDEIRDRTQAFYTQNKLDQWTNAKAIISSRPEYLGPAYQSQFQKRGQTRALQEYWLSPISDDWISAYIEKYIQYTQRTGWDLERYQSALNRLPTLKEAIRRPFLLHMALDLLPDLTESKAQPITRITLYDEFISRWWNRSEERLQHIQLTKEEKAAQIRLGKDLSAKGLCASQEMAVTLTQKGVIQAFYDPERNEVAPEAWRAYFEEDAEKRLLLFNAPLIHQGQHYRFIHKSIQDYCVARAICGPRFNSAVLNADAVLNQCLLVDEPLILDFLLERVKQQSSFKACLYAWIEASKESDAPVKIGAANAITVLVRAGEQFNGADLKGISIPGADLSFGVFDSAQLQGSDLSGVQLRASWLRQTNLRNAQMVGVQFGEWPYLEEESLVHSCAYSPDGKSCAVGLGNGNISVYMTSNWEKIHTLEGHTWSVLSVVYSPSGTQIASGSKDTTVRLWDAHSGALAHTLEGHSGYVYSVVYSPSGTQIASGSWDKTVRLWDAHSGALGHTLEGHTWSVRSVVYSPSGTQIASGSEDNTVRLWDAHSGALAHTLEGHTHFVSSVVYSPSGTQIASGSEDNTVRLWDAHSGALGRTLEGHTHWVSSVAYSPSGTQIASGSEDKTVRLWDAQTGVLAHTLQGHSYAVSSVVYSPSGTQIASSGSKDTTVRLWDAQSGALGHTLEGHTDWVSSVVYSPSGTQIASGSRDNTVRLWDAQSGALGHTLEGHTDWVSSVVYSPSGTQIASGSEDHTVRLWDAHSGALGHTLEGHTDWVSSVVYSPSGTQIASGSEDHTVRLWDAHSGALGHTLEGHTSGVNSVVYSPSGTQIASGSEDKTVRLWDAHSGVLGHTLEGHTWSVLSVVYSPSGTQIASGSKDTTVRLWDAHSGALGHTLEGHTSGVNSVVYSPSGTQIASGSNDTTVRLWDAHSGALGHTLEGHTHWVRSVVYSPSGTQIASGSYDETVRLWDVSSGECLRVIQGFIGGVPSVAWKATSKGTYLVAGSADKSVRTWAVKQDQEGYKVTLHWSSGHDVLTVQGALLEGIQGLSEMNRALLQQRGA